MKGSCLCGSVTCEVSAEPRFAIRCHCRDCQHVSGGGHLPQMAVPRAEFSPTGPLCVHHRVSEAGHAQVVGFCGTCGSPIYKSTARAEELVFLFAGSLDTPEEIPELREVYENRRLTWDHG